MGIAREKLGEAKPDQFSNLEGKVSSEMQDRYWVYEVYRSYIFVKQKGGDEREVKHNAHKVHNKGARRER